MLELKYTGEFIFCLTAAILLVVLEIYMYQLEGTLLWLKVDFVEFWKVGQYLLTSYFILLAYCCSFTIRLSNKSIQVTGFLSKKRVISYSSIKKTKNIGKTIAIVFSSQGMIPIVGYGDAGRVKKSKALQMIKEFIH